MTLITVIKKKNYPVLLLLTWTAAVLTSLGWNLYDNHHQGIQHALIEARTYYELNLAYRKWVADVGGVYVPADKVRPNPYLKVPDRDVTTTGGKALTLINPAYMTRLVFEIAGRSEMPVVSRITSLKPLHPINAPDEFEKAALISFEKGRKEVSGITQLNGMPYLRVIRPFITESTCLKCHAVQGYHEGDIRGGLSISVPMKPYFDSEAKSRPIIILPHLFIWLLVSIGISVVARKRVEAQRKIEESEWKFRTLSEAASDWEFWLDENKAVSYMAPSCKTMTGYKPEEFVADQGLISKVIHPDDREEWIRHLEQFQSPDDDIREVRIVTKDGDIRWLSHICRPMFAGEKFLGRRASNRDITDRKIAEEKLQNAYQLLELVFENTHILIALLDKDLNFIRVNRSYAAVDEKTPEFFPGKRHFDLYPDVENEEIFRKVMKTGEPAFFYAKPFKYKSHPERGVSYWDWSLLPVRDKDGTVAGLIFTLLNVTERHRAEEVLRQSRDKLMDQQRTLSLLTRGEAFAAGSIDDTVRRLTEIDARQLGVERVSLWRFTEDRTAIRCDDLFELSEQRHSRGVELKADDFPVYFAALDKAEAIVADDAHSHASTREFLEPYLIPLGITSMLDVPIHLYGKLAGVICHEHIGAPISWTPEQRYFAVSVANLAALALEQHERKRTEEEKQRLQAQLLQAQKMEAVGQLAGGVAHDFNNLLSAIVGYGSMTQMKMADDDPLKPNMQQILDAADKAAQLTQSLLAFSRKQVITMKPVDLNDIIRKVGKLLVRLIGEDIDFGVCQSEESLTVMADRGQIEQVLMNLATNARDAMPRGGMLAVRTERAIENDFIKSQGPGAREGYALLSVTDTGVGMDEETRQRIFEPFFTTKGIGKGTGLGLAMVYGIIEQHNGFIDVSSSPGSGTTFSIYLPLTRHEEEPIETVISPTLLSGTETILIAEDDDTLRKLLESILKEFGYSVITAADGEDAVEKFRENSDKVDLVVLDVLMPRKGGREVLEEIRKMKPDIKSLFASGYAAEFINNKGLLEEGMEYIMKPVSPRDLLRKVREMLDRK